MCCFFMFVTTKTVMPRRRPTQADRRRLAAQGGVPITRAAARTFPHARTVRRWAGAAVGAYLGGEGTGVPRPLPNTAPPRGPPRQHLGEGASCSRLEGRKAA